MFTSYKVGKAAIRPEHITALACVLHDTKRDSVLISLMNEKSIYPKLYAMAALRDYSPNLYNKYLPMFKSNPNEIKSMQGCIISNSTVSDIIKAIDSGLYSTKGLNKVKPSSG